MKRCLIMPLVIALMFITYNTHAQKKVFFASQNYFGILDGSTGTAFQLHTINGVSYKTWHSGIGIGLDYYYVRSIPVFISVTRFLNAKKNSPFIAANIGINNPWINQRDVLTGANEIYHKGSFWSGDIGYKLGFGKGKSGFLLSAGYSYKHIYMIRSAVNPCFNPPCPEYSNRYDYYLKRFSMKVGLMF